MPETYGQVGKRCRKTVAEQQQCTRVGLEYTRVYGFALVTALVELCLISSGTT